ncbi:unnamed protein product [Prorocentrum cordatum]|uniref:EF-hand domain-containing protein n=1 Tax=Prorocentrum cordatum TaxID=2364126 RepID=A0ABN9UDH9_9DINO|nr:unnamed protein product [Polarella glacialis]
MSSSRLDPILRSPVNRESSRLLSRSTSSGSLMSHPSLSRRACSNPRPVKAEPGAQVCATPSTAPGSPVSTRAGSKSSGRDSPASSRPVSRLSVAGSCGAPVAVVDVSRSRRGGHRPPSGAPAREDLELARSDRGSGPAPTGSSRPAGSAAAAVRSHCRDVAEACRLAKTMQVPLAEMQRAYAAFRDHAEPLAPGADLLRDGRLGQEQFARLMQSQFNLDSDVSAERQVQRMASSVKKVCKAVCVHGDRGLSFCEFLECTRILCFDKRHSLAEEERGLRRMALKYGLDPVEIDRYKKEFDELDVDRSGRIDSQEMESLLSFIGLADTYKPVLGDSIGFEDFLIFSLRYLTPGATGFRQSSGSTGGDARPEA